MGTTLNQSKQTFRAIGLVNELNLEREDCEIKVKDKDGNESTIDGERIRGKVAVNINGGIKVFNVFVNSKTSKGEDSKQWKNAEKMLELNPEIGGDSNKEPSLVSVTGRVEENTYPTDDGVKTTLRWSANRISTSRVSDEDEHGCTLSGVFYIKAIRAEEKNEEETGRLLVTLCAVGYGASPIVIETIVQEDLAEAFNDMYDVGQTAQFDIDVVNEHVGKKTTGKKAFGDSGKIKSTGFDREILVIVGGDEPIEEPDEEDEDGNIVDNGWIDPKAMKMALKERDIKIEEIKKNGKTTTTKSAKTTSIKEKKRMGAKKIASPIPDDEDDGTDPFDDDEDF